MCDRESAVKLWNHYAWGVRHRRCLRACSTYSSCVAHSLLAVKECLGVDWLVDVVQHVCARLDSAQCVVTFALARRVGRAKTKERVDRLRHITRE